MVSELQVGQVFKFRAHFYVKARSYGGYKDVGLGGYTKYVGFLPSTRVEATSYLYPYAVPERRSAHCAPQT